MCRRVLQKQAAKNKFARRRPVFDTNDHEYEIPFSGDPASALEVARTALLGQGFEIVDQSSGELRATGPGMNSTNQPPLCGVSEITFLAGTSAIVARARLGGVRKMKMFLWLFPPGLGLVLMVLFTLLGMPHSWTVLLAVAPWLVLSPIMSSWIEQRTTKAVDSLARSMVQVAKKD
jgi:hypothetical protein